MENGRQGSFRQQLGEHVETREIHAQAHGCRKEKRAVAAESRKAGEQGGRMRRSFGGTEGDRSGLERTESEIYCRT